MDMLNERDGVQKERKGEGEKDLPPAPSLSLTEETGNKSLHFSSAGGESAVQTTKRLLLCLLSVLFSLIFFSTPQTEQEKKNKKEEWKAEILGSKNKICLFHYLRAALHSYLFRK